MVDEVNVIKDKIKNCVDVIATKRDELRELQITLEDTLSNVDESIEYFNNGLMSLEDGTEKLSEIM